MEKLIRDRIRDLRENTNFSMTLFESLVGYAIVAADFDGNIIAYNEGACQIYGYKSEEVIGKHNIEILFPKDFIEQGKLQQVINNLIGEEKYAFEGEGIRKNGTKFPAQILLTLTKDKDGRVIGLIEIAQDLTERKRAEEMAALRRSEEHFRSLIENASDIITVLNGDGTVRYQSPSVERVLGYKPEDVLGRNGFELVHPDDVQKAMKTFTDIVQNPGTALSVELRFRHKNGSWRILESIGKSHLDSSGAASIVVNSRDITERKQAEEERAQLLIREQAARAEAEAAQRRLKFLAEASTLLATSLDYSTTLESVARLAVPYIADWCFVDLVEEDGSLRRLAVAHAVPSMAELAHRLRQYLPRPNAPYGLSKIVQTGHPEIISEVSDSTLAALAYDEEHLRILHELDPKSFMIVPLLVRGRILGAISFVAAESNRHYSSADLALAQDLARRAALAIDNARLYHEAQEADRRKDEFLAMLGHELRNPLAPILNAIQVIRLHSGEDPVLKRTTDVVERQTRHMTRLIDDLLDVSRITRGKIQLKKERIDLATVMMLAVETSRPLIETYNHKLSVSLPQKPVRLEADPARLEQVLVNLLNNAAKYTEPGGHIWLSGERQGDEVILQVRDTGMGILPEMLPRIFDLFTQGDQSLARSQGGLGVGLTLVRGLVEMHGGSVTAYSPGPGRGSEFIVRLPAPPEVQRCPDAETWGEEDRPIPPSSYLRILVVDDNVDSARTLGELLELWGHEVRVAYDGQAAIETATTYRPEVVLLDIGLPRMDGYEVARRLRQDIGLSQTVLIALTGYGQEEDRRLSREAGFDFHFTKPIDFTVLQQLLGARNWKNHPSNLHG